MDLMLTAALAPGSKIKLAKAVHLVDVGAKSLVRDIERID